MTAVFILLKIKFHNSIQNSQHISSTTSNHTKKIVVIQGAAASQTKLYPYTYTKSYLHF